MSEISQIERVPDEELDQMIWKLERDGGMTPKLLSLMRELREVRRANSEKLNQPVSETETLPSEYLQGHQDGLEWAAQMAEANHPQTGDWLYDDPIALAAAIRKGPDMPLASGNSPATPDGWIKCSERMPEDEQEVLTRNRMGHCFVSFFDEHSGLFFDRVDVAAACCIEHILVTHWMPLPAAPQQDVRLALEIGMSRYAGAMQKLVDSGD